MIVGSLLLIVAAVVLFVFGLVRGSNGFLVGSIGASLLAAIMLVLGSRRIAGGAAQASPDEPAVQPIAADDTARTGLMDAVVRVVDGRPQFHLADCRHLSGRVSEALPVAEAVELGFSPCAVCAPGNALLADAKRAW